MNTNLIQVWEQVIPDFPPTTQVDGKLSKMIKIEQYIYQVDLFKDANVPILKASNINKGILFIYTFKFLDDVYLVNDLASIIYRLDTLWCEFKQKIKVQEPTLLEFNKYKVVVTKQDNKLSYTFSNDFESLNVSHPNIYKKVS